jgi:hypothetical protein
MKKTALFCALALLAGPLLGDSAGSGDVNRAVKKITDIADYTWHSTFTDPRDPQSISADGQTAPDGFTYVKLSFADNSSEFVLKNGMLAITDQSGNWQPPATLDTRPEVNRLSLSLAHHFRTPAAQAATLVSAVGAFKKEGNVFSGDLTADGANALLTVPDAVATNSVGSAKFWITDGNLTRFEFKVKGTSVSHGVEEETSRDTSVEIKYVGTTKVTMPNQARSLLP